MANISELTLNEILADPIVHLVMARDGVAEIDVRELIGRALRSRFGSAQAGSHRESPPAA